MQIITFANLEKANLWESSSPCVYSKQILETTGLPAFSKILFFKFDEQKRESGF